MDPANFLIVILPSPSPLLLFTLSAFVVVCGMTVGAIVVFGRNVVIGRGVVVDDNIVGACVVFAGIFSTQHFILDDGHGTSSSTS